MKKGEEYKNLWEDCGNLWIQIEGKIVPNGSGSKTWCQVVNLFNSTQIYRIKTYP